jgi:hypothetical protein
VTRPGHVSPRAGYINPARKVRVEASEKNCDIIAAVIADKALTTQDIVAALKKTSTPLTTMVVANNLKKMLASGRALICFETYIGRNLTRAYSTSFDVMLEARKTYPEIKKKDVSPADDLPNDLRLMFGYVPKGFQPARAPDHIYELVDESRPLSGQTYKPRIGIQSGLNSIQAYL